MRIDEVLQEMLIERYNVAMSYAYLCLSAALSRFQRSPTLFKNKPVHQRLVPKQRGKCCAREQDDDSNFSFLLALCCWLVGGLGMLSVSLLAWGLKDGLGPNSMESHGWVAAQLRFWSNASWATPALWPCSSWVDLPSTGGMYADPLDFQFRHQEHQTWPNSHMPPLWAVPAGIRTGWVE